MVDVDPISAVPAKKLNRLRVCDESIAEAMDEEQNEIYAVLQPVYLNFLAGTAGVVLREWRLRRRCHRL